MSDDWRVQVRCANSRAAESLGERLSRGEIEHQLQTSAGERVVVSVDENELFLYAGTREQAQAAADAVKGTSLSGEEEVGGVLSVELRHWHPVAEEWEDPDVPLPADRAATSAEKAQLMAEEDAQSEKSQLAEFEVRITLAEHHEVVAFAQLLRQRGLTYVRRWHYILIGAGDQQAAEQLADQLREVAPAGTKIVVEGTALEARSEMPQNPFVMFGGLGY